MKSKEVWREKTGRVTVEQTDDETAPYRVVIIAKKSTTEIRSPYYSEDSARRAALLFARRLPEAMDEFDDAAANVIRFFKRHGWSEQDIRKKMVARIPKLFASAKLEEAMGYSGPDSARASDD